MELFKFFSGRFTYIRGRIIIFKIHADRKLITADPSGQMVLTEGSSHKTPCFGKYLITVRVPVGIIDPFEVIKIKYDKRNTFFRTACFDPVIRQKLESALIKKSRELVCRCFFIQIFYYTVDGPVEDPEKYQYDIE